MSLGHGKLSEKTLLRMEHYSGACLLILALIHGGNIIWQMHNKALTPVRQSSQSSASRSGLAGKLIYVAGVAVGTGAWFTGPKPGSVSLGHGKLSEHDLLRMNTAPAWACSSWR